ncbi:hypothetical protein BX616_008743, partial [Lobosporangium transversale]
RKNAQLQQLVDIHQKGKEESNGATGSSLYASEQLNRQNSASSLVRSATEVGLFKMNDQLRNELEQRSKATEKEREKTRSALRELDAANAQCYQLQQQLSQRENVIKNTLSRIE